MESNSVVTVASYARLSLVAVESLLAATKGSKQSRAIHVGHIDAWRMSGISLHSLG